MRSADEFRKMYQTDPLGTAYRQETMREMEARSRSPTGPCAMCTHPGHPQRLESDSRWWQVNDPTMRIPADFFNNKPTDKSLLDTLKAAAKPIAAPVLTAAQKEAKALADFQAKRLKKCAMVEEINALRKAKASTKPVPTRAPGSHLASNSYAQMGWRPGDTNLHKIV